MRIMSQDEFHIHLMLLGFTEGGRNADEITWRHPLIHAPLYEDPSIDECDTFDNSTTFEYSVALELAAKFIEDVRKGGRDPS